MNRKRRARNRKKRKNTALKCIIFVLFLTFIGVACVFGLKAGVKTSREIKYPFQYKEYIIQYSNENQLDPYLVAALIKQESNFIPDAKSYIAGGLMQLTEDTAEHYGAMLGLEDFDYMDPETNIKIGCYFLKSMIKRYGVTDTALAAYNAGPGNVDLWLKDPRYSSDGITLTYIPYPETSNYVAGINKYYKEYKSHYDRNNE